MKKINEIMRELKAISNIINKVAEQTGYVEFGDMNLLDIDMRDADELFVYDEINQIVDSLAEIQGNIDYMGIPIKYESKLMKNEDGRYETEQGEYYECGRVIEYVSHDESQHENEYWRKSRIGNNGVDYYIIAEPTLQLEGLNIRVRGRKR